MKKLLILLMLLIAFPVIAETKKATLINEYGDKVVVTVDSEEAQDYFGLGFYLYTEESFGAVASSPALFRTNLASKIVETDTEMTLVSVTTRDGTDLSGSVCFTIDGSLSVAEYVCGTASGTLITDLERGLGSDGVTEYTDLKFEHRYGAVVKITDFPILQRHSNIINGASDFPSDITANGDLIALGGTVEFENAVILASSTTPTLDNHLATKKYVDDTAISGSPNATDSVKGIVELATQSEMISSTRYGSTGAALVLPNRWAGSVRYEDGVNIVVTGSDGYIDHSRLDLSENFEFASTTFTGSTTWEVLPEYDSDPVGDDEATRKSYVDTTTKKLEIDTTGVTFGNTATETTIAQISIPAKTLSTNNAVRVKVLVNDFDIDNDSTFTFAMKYDDTTIFSKSLGDGTSVSLTDLGGYMEFYLVGNTATSSQVGFGTIDLFDNSIDNDAIQSVTGNGNGTASENSDTILNLTITGKYNTINDNDSFTSIGYIVETIK